MESKVNYTAVGAFVVLLCALLGGAVWWLAKAGAARDQATYLIYASDNVNGLRPASDVLYRGVKVGQVSNIDIDPDNPALVRITVQIGANVPVRADTVAQLTPQGVTGLSVIGLTGGKSPDALVARPGQPYPVIPYAPSVFSRLEGGLNDATLTLSRIAGRLDALLSPANVRAVSDTLRHVDAVTATVDSHRDDIAASLAALRDATQQLAAMGQQGHELSVQGRQTLAQVGSAAQSLQSTLVDVDAAARTWNKAGEGAAQLSVGGVRTLDHLQQRTLPGIDRLGDRLQQLSLQLDALVRSLKADPSQLLYGTAPPPPGPGETP